MTDIEIVRAVLGAASDPGNALHGLLTDDQQRALSRVATVADSAEWSLRTMAELCNAAANTMRLADNFAQQVHDAIPLVRLCASRIRPDEYSVWGTAIDHWLSRTKTKAYL